MNPTKDENRLSSVKVAKLGVADPIESLIAIVDAVPLVLHENLTRIEIE